MIKIAHLADIHIQDRRREEYAAVFNKLYTSLRSANVNLIVVAGDVFDNKMKASPHNLNDVANFLTSLTKIAPVILIAGNHDTNCLIPGSLDLLTPLIAEHRELQPPKLTYWRNSGVYVAHNIVWTVIATDGEKNPTAVINDSSMPHICLFHEEVNGAFMNNGTEINEFKLSKASFSKYDLVMGGHIHLRQRFAPRAAYCGSLIQQNIGEHHHGHGYLLWELTTEGAVPPYRTAMPIMKEVDIDNVNGFVRIELDKNGNDITKYPIPLKPHYWELLYDGGETPPTVEKYTNIFNMPPRAIRRKNAAIKDGGGSPSAESSLANAQTASKSLEAHEEIIRELLTSNCDAEIIEGVLALHRQYWIAPTQIYGGKFRIINFEFDNLYAFGPSNVVNFIPLEGCVSGVIASNHSGKSSLIDALLFALYEEHPRTLYKKEILHKGTQSCRLSLEFELDGKRGTIIKGMMSGKQMSSQYKFIYNGEDRTKGGTTETLAEIKSVIGDASIALASSFQLQGGENIGFISSTPPNRKKLIATVMGLGSFENIERQITKEYTECNGEVRALASQSRGKSLDELSSQLATIEQELNALDKNSISELKRKATDAEQLLGSHLITVATTRNNINELQKRIANKQYCDPINYEEKNQLWERISSLKIELKRNLDELSKFPKIGTAAYPYNVIAHGAGITAIHKSETRPTDIDIKNAAANLCTMSQADNELADMYSRDREIELTVELKNYIPKKLTPPVEDRPQYIPQLEGKKGIRKSHSEVQLAMKLITATDEEYAAAVIRSQKCAAAVAHFKTPIRPAAIGIRAEDNLITIEMVNEAKEWASAMQHVAVINSQLRPQTGCTGCAHAQQLFNNNALSSANKAANELQDKYNSKLLFEYNKAMDELAKLKAQYESAKQIENAFNTMAIEKYYIMQLINAWDVFDAETSQQKIFEKLHAELVIQQNAHKKYNQRLLNAESINILERANYWASIDHKCKLRMEQLNCNIEANKSELATIEKKYNEILIREKNSPPNIAEHNSQLTSDYEKITELKQIAISLDKELHTLELNAAAASNEFNQRSSEMEMRICTLTNDRARIKQELEFEASREGKYRSACLRQSILKAYRTILHPVGGIGDILLERSRAAIELQINNALRELGANFIIEIKQNYDIFMKLREWLPISLGSGYQKFVLSLAARLAIWRLSINPRPDAFIIDEGFGVCDGDYLDSMASALEALAGAPDGPKLVFIVSHIDALKTRLERTLEIEVLPNCSKIINVQTTPIVAPQLRVDPNNVNNVICDLCNQSLKSTWAARHLQSAKHLNRVKK